MKARGVLTIGFGTDKVQYFTYENGNIGGDLSKWDSQGRIYLDPNIVTRNFGQQIDHKTIVVQGVKLHIVDYSPVNRWWIVECI